MLRNPFKKEKKPEVDEFGDERGEGTPLAPNIRKLIDSYKVDKEGVPK